MQWSVQKVWDLNPKLVLHVCLPVTELKPSKTHLSSSLKLKKYFDVLFLRLKWNECKLNGELHLPPFLS